MGICPVIQTKGAEVYLRNVLDVQRGHLVCVHSQAIIRHSYEGIR